MAFGMTNFRSQIAHLESEIWHLPLTGLSRGAERGRGLGLLASRHGTERGTDHKSQTVRLKPVLHTKRSETKRKAVQAGERRTNRPSAKDVCRKRLKILKAFGTIDFDSKYNYKHARRKR
jgi:hypothetical protein